MLVLLFPHRVMRMGWIGCVHLLSLEPRLRLLGVKVFIFDKSNYEGSNYLQGGGGPRKATLGCKNLSFREGAPPPRKKGNSRV